MGDMSSIIPLCMSYYRGDMPPQRKKPYKPERRTDRNSIGLTVGRLRSAQNLTRDELSARAQLSGWDISPYVVKRIERCEREVTDIELRKLAKALRVPAAVLLE
jgi:hypothetical protein